MSQASLVREGKGVISTSFVEETEALVCSDSAQSSSAQILEEPVGTWRIAGRGLESAQDDRLEEQRRAQEAEKAAARKRTLENVLRHYAV